MNKKVRTINIDVTIKVDDTLKNKLPKNAGTVVLNDADGKKQRERKSVGTTAVGTCRGIRTYEQALREN